MRAFRRELALYPVAATCLPVLFLFVTSGASPFAVLRSLLGALILGFGLAILGRVLAGDRDIGGLVALLGLFLLMGVGQPAIAVLVLVLLVALVAAARLPRSRRPEIRWNMIGTAARRIVSVAALAVVIQSVQVGTPGTVLRAVDREAPWRSGPAATADAPDGAPDVYLLMLDGYARPDVLRDVFGDDDAAYIEALERRGFTWSPQSHANYPVTALSLISMLDMRHLTDIPSIREGQAAGISQGTIIRTALNQARGLGVARDHGYEIIGVSSGYEQLGLREADRFLDTGQLNEFEVQALALSGLSKVVEMVAPDGVTGQWRDRIAASFDAIEAVAAEVHERPRLVLGHVPSPHAPWLHTPDGGDRLMTDTSLIFQETSGTTRLSSGELEAAFLAQTAYVRSRAIETIDQILATATRPTAVIVFSDHGPAHAMEVIGYPARLANLFAARTPGQADLYATDQSLVNVLPRLWNAYLGLDLPLSADTSYVWASTKDLLDLQPVTGP